MSNLSTNFSRNEFSCRGINNKGGHPGQWCGNDTVDAELILILEDVRQVFGGNPILITSGCRCPVHNRHEGGADGSFHILGKGADFKIKNVHADNVADYMEQKYPDKYGIGRYVGRTHVDCRFKKARWDTRP
jgi:uncharacterized protein YcbK (DUF882 family)